MYDAAKLSQPVARYRKVTANFSALMGFWKWEEPDILDSTVSDKFSYVVRSILV